MPAATQPSTVVEDARRLLRLTYLEIAHALQVDESTLHRWRATSLSRRRATSTTRGTAALDRLMAALRAHFAPAGGVAGDDDAPLAESAPDARTWVAARAWLDAPNARCGGDTPRAALVKGRADFLLGVLDAERATPAPAADDAPAGDDATFRCAPVGMAHVSLAGEFIAVNPKLGDMLGYTPAELVGRRWQDITHPDDLASDLDKALQLVTGALESYTIQKRYLRRDGRPIWVRLSGSVVRDAAGAPRYAIAVVDPLPDIEAAALRLALGHSPGGGATEGVWEWDVTSGDVYWSPQIATSLGRAPDDIAPNFEAFAALVHPDDLAPTRAAIDDYLAGRTRVYEAEFRMRHASGAWRWVHSRGRALARDADGRPTRIAGLHTDVTGRREAEASARRRLAELEAIYESAPVGLCALDRDLRVVRINARLAAMNGMTVEEHIGLHAREFLPRPLVPVLLPLLERVRETGEPVRGFELQADEAEQPGTTKRWLLNYFPMRDESGDVVGVNTTVVEITGAPRAAYPGA